MMMSVSAASWLQQSGEQLALYGSGSAIHQSQNDDHEQYQTQASARIVSPSRAVAPCGQRSNEQKQQHQDQNDSEHVNFFVSRIPYCTI
jgi:hypothetical protein